MAGKNPKKEISLNPGDGGSWGSKIDELIGIISEVVRQNPNDANPLVEWGIAFGLNGEYEKAFADFDKAIRLDPNEDILPPLSIKWWREEKKSRILPVTEPSPWLNVGRPRARQRRRTR